MNLPANPEQEIQLAAAGAPLLAPRLHLASVEIRGADARTFLHSQFTTDVKSLQAGQAQLSAWCTAKGRVVANFILYPLASDASGNTFRLMLPPDLLAGFIKRLQMYVLRAQVTLTNLSDTPDTLDSIGHTGLSGANIACALEAIGLPVPENPLSVVTQGETDIIRLPDGRFILCALERSLRDIWTQLYGQMQARIQRAGQISWEWLDIQAALPWISSATTEAFVPQMMDFEKMGGVSFKKGCYPGQEIVARSQYLGQVKRHLYSIASPHPLAPGEDLHSPLSPDQAAGKVITAVSAADPTGAYAALAVVLESAAADLRQGSVDGAIVQAAPVYQTDG
jgi:folate-binding protein YgfZ